MSVVSRPGNAQYRENYDRIFGEKDKETLVLKCPSCGDDLYGLLFNRWVCITCDYDSTKDKK
jgi:hypothetical protein